MRIATTLVFALLTGTLGAVGLAEAGQSDGERGSLSGKVFYVEATIVSSPTFPEWEGAVLQTCFTFNPDGTWIDNEWPGTPEEPIPGVWIQHDDFPFLQFSAYATYPAAGWTAVEYGFASPSAEPNGQRMRTYGMVFSATNELLFYLETQGHAVETCPL